jgi:hypothetical protein
MFVMDWGQVVVAAAVLAGVVIERAFSSRQATRTLQAEIIKDQRRSRRQLYVDWLNFTASMGEFAHQYISRGAPGPSMLTTDFQRKLRELSQAISLDAPPNVVKLTLEHSTAIGNASPDAWEEAMAAEPTPGVDPPLLFGIALREKTETQRYAVLNAMREDLGQEPIPDNPQVS